MMIRTWLLAVLIFLSSTPPVSSNESDTPIGGEIIVAPGAELDLSVAEDAAHVEAALDGGPLKPVTGVLNAPGSGDHWLAAASRDMAGNRSAIRWIRLRVDGEPPSLTLSSDPSAFVDKAGRRWIPPGAFAVAEAHDDLAGIARLKLTLGERIESAEVGSVRLALPDTGEPDTTAVALDRVGNRTEASLKLHVDPDGPLAELLVRGPQVGSDPVVMAPSGRVEARIEDLGSGLAGWTLRLDGQAAPPDALEGPWTAGLHLAEANASDRVGNETRVDLRVMVDAAGPEIRWQAAEDGVTNDRGELVYRPPVQMEVAATDAPAGLAILEVSLDAESFHTYAGPLTLEQESLHIRATDRVDNVKTLTATWRLDSSAPKIRLFVGELEVPPGERFEIRLGDVLHPRVRDEAAGVGEASYRFERAVLLRPVDQSWRPLPEAIELPRTGLWCIVIEAVDQLGHKAFERWEISVVRQGGK